MLDLNLKANSKSCSELFGISDDRFNKIAEAMSNSFSNALGEDVVDNNINLMKKVLEDVNPETPEELAVIMYGMASTIDMFVQIKDSSIGAMSRLLAKTKVKIAE